MNVRLVIGNKNYSTWSLRPWLFMKHHNLAFEEIPESLQAEGLRERLLNHSPSARVPVLLDDGLCIWDSLAICEWVSERYLSGAGWPEVASARAMARALVCEMHAGFNALRQALPMNLRARGRSVKLSPAAKQDLERITDIWSQCRALYGSEGPWLMGRFSLVDAFYAPVALRFPTYGITLPPAAQCFVEQVQSDAHVISWVQAALEETELVAEDEAGDAGGQRAFQSLL